MAWSVCLLRRPGWAEETLNGFADQTDGGLYGAIRRLGIPLTLTDVTSRGERTSRATSCPGDLVVRWGCTSRIDGTDNVLNPASAIRSVSDKPIFRLRALDIPEIQSLILPTYIDSRLFTPSDATPYVVRASSHARGSDFHVVRSPAEMEAAMRACDFDWYASPVFPKTHEYRVFVIQGRVGWVVRKTPDNPGDTNWHFEERTSYSNVRWGNWPLDIVDAAVKVMRLGAPSLDFGAVDVLFNSRTQERKVCEINTAPYVGRYHAECLAKILAYIANNESKERMDVISGVAETYRSYIHPALTSEARLLPEEPPLEPVSRAAARLFVR